MTYSVIKKNSRMRIMKNGVDVYVIPNFIKLNSKKQLQELCDKFNEKGTDDILDIIAWETKMRPVKV